MARSNDVVAELLGEYAELVAIVGSDAFKARAYEKAARAIAGYPSELDGLDEAGIRQIPNVGRSIADKIAEARNTGTFAQLEELRAEIPPGVLRLMRIPTLGPKKALMVYQELGIAEVDELAAAIDAGRLRGLKGFGPKTEENIRAGIELMRKSGGRVLMSAALDVAQPIVTALSTVAGCVRCTYAGSLRRGRESIGDVDILAAAADSTPLMAAFAELPQVERVLVRGETKTSIRTTAGLQVDLRVVPPECWGAALQYFTGSREHNVAVREIAVGKGLKLSEYGLFSAESGELIVADTEEAVYSRLGLAWVPPELREDRGEVAAARRGEVPELVDLDDLRGDLHTHTDLTDGVSSLTEMLDAAAARGYDYYAVTDHAPDLFMQRMTLDKALAQRASLRELQPRYPDMKLLHGTELNIGPDGSVDWPQDVLAGFDVCVASVHSHFTLSRAEQTRRLIRACENPGVHVIGHPTGRLIGRREPIDVDLDAVFEVAARTGTIMELNGGPDRLDLRDEHLRWAARHGVRFAISSDAHAVPQLDFVRYATITARRGWLRAEDVVTTWPYERLVELLRDSRPAPWPSVGGSRGCGGVSYLSEARNSSRPHHGDVVVAGQSMNDQISPTDVHKLCTALPTRIRTRPQLCPPPCPPAGLASGLLGSYGLVAGMPPSPGLSPLKHHLGGKLSYPRGCLVFAGSGNGLERGNGGGLGRHPRGRRRAGFRAHAAPGHRR